MVRVTGGEGSTLTRSVISDEGKLSGSKGMDFVAIIVQIPLSKA